MTQRPANQFTENEIAIQERLGFHGAAEKFSPFIRDFMPDQHRAFFEQLPLVIAGFLDEEGKPWALPVTGKTGFIRSPDRKSLHFANKPPFLKELGISLKEGSKVGIVGVELPTRRRNRMNGIVGPEPEQGFMVQVEHSFGNCPQYIQARAVEFDSSHPQNPVAIKSAGLSEEAASLIKTADTFFITSRTTLLDDDPRHGLDSSHRGGRPGFVRVEGDELTFPDFSGNRFFNTIGNIETDGRVGLFFANFEKGTVVLVSGRAHIIWDGEDVSRFEGAERLIKMVVDETLYAENALPVMGELVQQWPLLAMTGTWDEVAENSAYDPIQLTDRRKESDDVVSFSFIFENGKAVHDYQAGQFLPVRLQDYKNGEVLMRSYTLSKAPDGMNYRLSIKKDGRFSSLLHDHLEIGRLIEAGKPSGDFVLKDNGRSIVMLAAGIGITPMLAMTEELIKHAHNGKTPPQVYFFYSAKNSALQPFHEQLTQWEKEYDWFHLTRLLSQPLEHDEEGVHYDYQGRLGFDILKETLPFDAYDYYMCGPEAFMRSLYKQLGDAGISKEAIHYEFFGSGSIEEDETPAPEKAPVSFANAKIETEWTKDQGSLLDFAEKQGLTPKYNCRSGKCGTCSTKLLEGEVHYTSDPVLEPEDGHVLICCCRPKDENKVVLDL